MASSPFPAVEAHTLPWVTAEQMATVDSRVKAVHGIRILQMMENAGRNLARLARARFELDSGAPARQLATLTALKVRMATLGEDERHSIGPDRTEEDTPSLVIDGLIGYSLVGKPRGSAAALLQLANRADAPVLSLDVPSGLDPSSGAVSEHTIRVTATLTLALPKAGLRESWSHTGDLYLADISVPATLFEELGLEVPPRLFAKSEILQVVGS